MKNKILKVITLIVMIALVAVSLYLVDNKLNNKREYAKLVMFGDNIKTDYTPFIENGGVYISVDTISKVIDEYIYYDKIATKVIITTDTNVVKLKIDENKISKNFELSDITTPAKLINGEPYIDISLLKDIYNIKVSYNEETATISIDDNYNNELSVEYNRVNVYSDITTDSDVIATLNKGDSVTVYLDSLDHKRWYKIKTDSGVVGYISKNAVEIIERNEALEQLDCIEIIEPKIEMFWQYGTEINTLGEKENGVNIVSPTMFELKNSNGDISSKFSANYYEKAKANGYKLWPIITNGIDSVNYSYDDTSNMLNSEKNREAFIKNVIDICKNNNLDGINMDFESMKVDDRDLYSQLIKEMAPMLRNNGITLSVDTYFVSYIDRKVIGKFADYVVLMGYDQRGSWSTEAGSISECGWVEKNIISLIEDSKIPSKKIILGVPFYTRVWIQNNVSGNLTTKIYTMKDCIDFVKSYGLSTSYDEKAGQNYAEYKTGNLTYKLWIEDETSMKNRVDIIKKYDLAGISAWRRGFETGNIWNVISENMNVNI